MTSICFPVFPNHFTLSMIGSVPKCSLIDIFEGIFVPSLSLFFALSKGSCIILSIKPLLHPIPFRQIVLPVPSILISVWFTHKNPCSIGFVIFDVPLIVGPIGVNISPCSFSSSMDKRSSVNGLLWNIHFSKAMGQSVHPLPSINVSTWIHSLGRMVCSSLGLGIWLERRQLGLDFQHVWWSYVRLRGRWVGNTIIVPTVRWLDDVWLQ